MPADTFTFSFQTDSGSYQYVIKSQHKNKNTSTRIAATVESSSPITGKSFDNTLEQKIATHDEHISSLKSNTNPITITREAKLKEGETLKVHFDENVAVYLSGINSKSFKEKFFEKIQFKIKPNKCPKLPSFIAKEQQNEVMKKKKGAAVFSFVICVLLIIIII
eukprot:UN12489